MARKDRVPPPPRRVQAPKKRAAAAKAGSNRQRLLLVVGGAVLVALAVVLGFLLLGGGGQSEAAVLREEGCTLESFPGQKGDHVDDPEAEPEPAWNSSPPTSGDHASAPAVYGFYTTPVDLKNSLHNLEHGAIVIHFGDDVPDETVAQLEEFYAEDPTGLLVAQLPELGDKITLSAWTAPEPGALGRGYLATCSGFSERAFSTFVEEHRYKGPERFPPENLQPGST